MRFLAYYEVLIDTENDDIDEGTNEAEDEADQIRSQIGRRTKVNNVKLQRLDG